MKAFLPALIACAASLLACNSSVPIAPPDAGSDAGVDAGPLDPPSVTSIAPNSGPSDGGTAVTVIGQAFRAGATLRIGGAPATAVQVLSATRLTGTTPPAAAAGKVDVVVVNSDQQLGRLSQGFEYTAPVQGPHISYCVLNTPKTVTVQSGATVTWYGEVYAQGVTEGTSQGAGIHMQFGYGADANSISWTDAVYNGKQPGQANNDEYKLTLGTAPVGSYATLFRAQLNGGDWNYCEQDGLHAAIDQANLGSWTVTAPPPAQLDYCALNQVNWANTAIPGSVIQEYGEIYKAGVTDQAGQGAGIEVQFGLGQPDGGGFTWADAGYNGKQPAPPPTNAHNDEYVARVNANPPGAYATAFRARLDGGAWTYCEKDGLHPGLDQSQLGSLGVPATVQWCNLQAPSASAGYAGDPLTLYGQVYQPGLTDTAFSQGPGITMQAGIGPADGGPFTWTTAVFNSAYDGGANDEYFADLTYPAAGSYRTAYRSMFGDAGVWAYCEVDGLHARLDLADAGVLTALPVPTTISGCTSSPAAMTALPGQSLSYVDNVLVNGWTGASRGGVTVENSVDVKADGGATWTAAQPASGGMGGADAFHWSGVAPGDAGSYLTAARAKVNGGPWVYCGPNSAFATFDAGAAGTLLVRPNSVDWCRLDGPAQQTGYYKDPIAVTGEVYVAGATDTALSTNVVAMQAGFGQPDGGGFAWLDAGYTGDAGNNYHHAWNGGLPASGSYALAMRASVNDGGWTLCELNGPVPSFDAADAGSITVNAVSIGGCNVQYPQYCDGGFTGGGGGGCGQTAYTAGQVPLKMNGIPDPVYYGQVYVNAASPFRGVAGQVGIGPLGSDPLVDGSQWRFFDAIYNQRAGNNDEWMAPLSLAENQDDALVYRFTGDGRTWTYCDQTFDNGGFSAARGSRYTVTSNSDFSSCKLNARAWSADAGASVTVSATVAVLDGGADYPTATPQILLGPAGTDPGGPGWTAYAAAPDGGDIHDGGAVFSADVQAPAGSYGVAFRIARFNGGWWSYGSADAGCAQGFQIAGEGTLTVAP